MTDSLPADLHAPWRLTREGFTEVVQGTQPAAGASFTFPMVGDYFTRPLSLVGQLVADANAANRYLHLHYQDAQGVVYAVGGSGMAIAANATVQFSLLADIGINIATTAVLTIAPLPYLFMRPTDVLKLDVHNIQAGDQLSQLVLVLERVRRMPPRD